MLYEAFNMKFLSRPFVDHQGHDIRS